MSDPAQASSKSGVGATDSAQQRAGAQKLYYIQCRSDRRAKPGRQFHTSKVCGYAQLVLAVIVLCIGATQISRSTIDWLPASTFLQYNSNDSERASNVLNRLLNLSMTWVGASAIISWLALTSVLVTWKPVNMETQYRVDACTFCTNTVLSLTVGIYATIAVADLRSYCHSMVPSVDDAANPALHSRGFDVYCEGAMPRMVNASVFFWILSLFSILAAASNWASIFFKCCGKRLVKMGSISD